MKEQLYTIPLNDAVDANDECPFCFIERNIERDLLDFVLGSSAWRPAVSQFLTVQTVTWVWPFLPPWQPWAKAGTARARAMIQARTKARVRFFMVFLTTGKLFFTVSSSLCQQTVVC